MTPARRVAVIGAGPAGADYVELFGADEARPIRLGGPVSDPQHFSRSQAKRIHPDDVRWLEAGEPQA